MPELCTYVTERATEGPCAFIYNTDEDCNLSPPPLHEVQLRARGILTHGHAYLGPVLARCGHPERKHVYGRGPAGVPRLYCKTCDDVDWHAYIEAA